MPHFRNHVVLRLLLLSCLVVHTEVSVAPQWALCVAGQVVGGT